MPFGVHRANYYEGLNHPSVVKAVGTSITGTTLGTLWTPASGKKFKLLGYRLHVHVGVILVNSVIGDFVALCDNVIGNKIENLGVFQVATAAPGVVLSTGAQHGTALATANTSAATANQWLPQVGSIPEGVTSGAADRVLKVGVAAAADGTLRDVGSGVIYVTGTVWGHEV